MTRIVDRLLDEGLVTEARRRRGLRGQPAIELEIDPDGLYAIGANIDRDHLTIIAVDATGTVRARLHHEERFLMPETFTALMEDALSSFLRRKVIREERLAGIGLAIPDWLGEVPVIGRPDAYGRWSGFDVRAALRKITAHPVFIDNDANAAALGEIEYGVGPQIRSFFYILVNACLGGSLVIDGVRHKGASGLGGEIGWLPVVMDEGPLAGHSRPLGDMFSLFILLVHLRAHGVNISTPAELVTLTGPARALVSAWLRRVSAKLAEAILDIGMIVDPDGVVIGGRLPVLLIDELLLYTNEEMARHGRPSLTLHRAASSDDAAALGAAAMPLAHRFGLPTAEAAQRERVPLASPGRLPPAALLTSFSGEVAP